MKPESMVDEEGTLSALVRKGMESLQRDLAGIDNGWSAEVVRLHELLKECHLSRERAKRQALNEHVTELTRVFI
jgi:hypothetical protein